MKKILFVLFITTSVLAQKTPEFFPGGTYDPRVITPDAVLGYRIGDRFTDYASLSAFFEKLVKSSDRIRQVVYAKQLSIAHCRHSSYLRPTILHDLKRSGRRT